MTRGASPYTLARWNPSTQRFLRPRWPRPSPRPPRPARAARSSGPVAGPLTPARVLAMQRSAGNQAVTAMLQREDQEKTPVAGPGTSGVSGGEPQVGGSVTAKPDGDGVRAESPDVKYKPAKVWLQEGKTLGGSQNFGFVQNLVTSTRGAVYRRGGDPAGDITSEPREGHGKAYDAVSDPNDDTKINKRGVPAVLLAAQLDERRERRRQPGRDRRRRPTTSRASRSRPRRTTGA